LSAHQTWAGSTAYAVLESLPEPPLHGKEKRVKGITGSTRCVCPIIIDRQEEGFSAHDLMG
jgi:hypothetical protein